MGNLSFVQGALRLLLEGYENARDLRVDCWQGARTAQELFSKGLSKVQLYFLVQNGYCQWRVGKKRPSPNDPSIPGAKHHAIRDGSLFVLTPAGAMLARQILYPLASGRKGRNSRDRSRGPSFPDLTLPAVPHFDENNHELWWGRHLVKRFTRPAPNLEAILMALEKSTWSEHIPIILTSNGNRLNKYQLRDAIKTWNASSLGEFVALHGDGLGLGIRWERLK